MKTETDVNAIDILLKNHEERIALLEELDKKDKFTIFIREQYELAFKDVDEAMTLFSADYRTFIYLKQRVVAIDRIIEEYEKVYKVKIPRMDTSKLEYNKKL